MARESDITRRSRRTPSGEDKAGRNAEELRIPIVEEEVRVGKRTVESGKLRISKHARREEQLLRIPVLSEHTDVRRVEVGREVEGPQPPRREGDTLIIPIMEQVPVVHLQWVVREEIHITKSTDREERRERISLTKEDIEVQRSAPGRKEHKEDSHGTHSNRSVRRDRPGKPSR